MTKRELITQAEEHGFKVTTALLKNLKRLAFCPWQGCDACYGHGLVIKAAK